MGGPNIPAVPPKFHLRMCLQSGEGKPFANRDYAIEWGTDSIKGKTDANGIVDQMLDGTVREGRLDLGEGAGDSFAPQITIPLKRVPVPTPPSAADDQDIRKKFDRDLKFFGAAWRLHNLGYLVLPESPSFPAQGNAPNSISGRDLLEAIQRYVFKNGLPPLDTAAVYMAPDWLDPTIADLAKKHDGK